MNNKVIREFQTAIVNWYAQKGRHLPWRDTDDPYKILIAELLLQKTDVEKVKVVYEKFMRLWPTVQLLSKEDVSTISKVIHPLGLKYKASRLKATAEAIVRKSDGKVPETEDSLLKLPGVGRYIASAVECFAFNKPKAVLDTNIIRIFNRVFEIYSKKDRPRDDIYLWNMAQRLVPPNNTKKYNWGLLDFGALVCKSREPVCSDCILHNICLLWKERKWEKNS
jgi:A/G-specific adenine glycosylase